MPCISRNRRKAVCRKWPTGTDEAGQVKTKEEHP
uniref:Uncharacterized protein n=1 Tax=Siphoviridae sp. ct3lF2 TaxID=2825324 RepID=A0A8S5PQL8_9CAUD|nr:MAG TPA: hypothetical protein [Siphoviridae sp. ct3lF2]